MSELDPLLNLIAISRQRALTPSEQQRLDRALESSASLRVAHQVSRDFAGVGAVQSGDEQLIDRAVGLALAEHRAQRRVLRRTGLPRRRWIWLSAAAVLVGGGAAFGFWVPRHWEGTKQASSSPAQSAPIGVSRDASTKIPRVAPPLFPDQKPTARPPAPSAVVPVEGPNPRVPLKGPRRNDLGGVRQRDAETSTSDQALSASTVKAFPPRPDAASLFSNANAARRGGDSGEAVRLFRELQREYPQSSEAAVSHLSLGRLLLGVGDWRGALEQFSAIRGALSEEAILGQAQAHARLGHTEEERAAWQLLLRRYPNSVYAQTARSALKRAENAADLIHAP